MSLHISSSASFINTTCLLASSSVCHDALQMLWTSCAKLTLAAFPSPSLKTVLHISFFLDTTKVQLKHAVENKLPARCMSGVSGLSVSVPLQTCRSSEKASRLTSRLNSALFARGCKQRATCDVWSSVEFGMIDNASLLHRPRQWHLKI